MIAKMIAHGPDRAEAIRRLDAALAASCIEGVKTNIPLLRAILAGSAFKTGMVHTGHIADLLAQKAGTAPETPGQHARRGR